MRLLKLAVLLLCLLPSLSHAGRGVPIKVPDAIVLAQPLNDTAMLAAISKAVNYQPEAWTVSFTRPGYVEATMQRKALRVVVGLLYTPSKVRMVYLANHGFHSSYEDDGQLVVHKKLNNWMNNLNLLLIKTLDGKELSGTKTEDVAAP